MTHAGGNDYGKIPVVEDDAATTSLISDYLTDAGHTVCSACDGLQALKKSAKQVIVPVFMLTALSDEETQAASFDCLADDYITKPFSMILLGKRVLTLLRRAGKLKESDIWRCGTISVDFNGYLAERDGAPIELAPKKIQLLKPLIENAGRVMTREQLIDGVWGINAPLYDRTIDTYIRRIRKNLALHCITTVTIALRWLHEAIKAVSQDISICLFSDGCDRANQCPERRSS